MKARLKPLKTIYGLMEKDHRVTLQKLDEFYDALRKFRYEGKMSLGKNLAEVSALVAFFESELTGHIREEEKVLFPFLQTHIPRLEPMVCLLVSEHEDFRMSLESLREALQDCRNHVIRSVLMDKIYEQGTYLICLLRNHLRAEGHTLYKAADRELRLSEKRKLVRKIEVNGRRRHAYSVAADRDLRAFGFKEVRKIAGGQFSTSKR